MLELFQITRFKLLATSVIALTVYLCGWMKPRILTFYVENSEFMERSPELKKLFSDFFALIEGDLNLVQRVALKSGITNAVFIVLLSYAAACVIAKIKFQEKTSDG